MEGSTVHSLQQQFILFTGVGCCSVAACADGTCTVYSQKRSFCFSKFKLLGFFRTYKFGHIAGIVSLQCCCYSSYTYSFGRIALFQRSSSTSATTKYTLHSLQGYSYIYSFGRIALLHRSSQ